MTAWDDIRAYFPDNTDGDISAEDMRDAVTDLETLDALNAKLAGPTFTGVPAAPTAAPNTNTTQLATTAFVEAESVLLNAAIDLKAPIDAPTFTGVPAAPTAAPDTNTTQIATTAFVEAESVLLNTAVDLKVNLTGSNQAYDTATGTTVLDADNYLLNCTSGTFTVTLPTAVGILMKEYVVKNSGAGVITLDGDTAETIDGELTQAINPNDCLTVRSTNAGWIII